ncbi:hypothetical protein BJF79_32625 [Actinomadura sp. CNU-125]|nr:hypothetical protein BJF79_32625 [Actinomadura sp. CNU-125]
MADVGVEGTRAVDGFESVQQPRHPAGECGQPQLGDAGPGPLGQSLQHRPGRVPVQVVFVGFPTRAEAGPRLWDSS